MTEGAIKIGKLFNHFLTRKGERIGKRFKTGDVLDFGNNRVYRMRKDGALINISKRRKKK